MRRWSVGPMLPSTRHDALNDVKNWFGKAGKNREKTEVFETVRVSVFCQLGINMGKKNQIVMSSLLSSIRVKPNQILITDGHFNIQHILGNYSIFLVKKKLTIDTIQKGNRTFTC